MRKRMEKEWSQKRNKKASVARHAPYMVRGAPDTIRTCDLLLRRETLYPAELRAQETIDGPRQLVQLVS